MRHDDFIPDRSCLDAPVMKKVQSMTCRDSSSVCETQYYKIYKSGYSDQTDECDDTTDKIGNTVCWKIGKTKTCFNGKTS